MLLSKIRDASQQLLMFKSRILPSETCPTDILFSPDASSTVSTISSSHIFIRERKPILSPQVFSANAVFLAGTPPHTRILKKRYAFRVGRCVKFIQR